MGRRSERLSKQGMLASDLAGEGDVIQVVSRAFDVLRCFEGHEARLGNLEISNRCGLPRSTVSRLTHTLTRMGQLVYLPRDQKYRIGPSAVAAPFLPRRARCRRRGPPAGGNGTRNSGRRQTAAPPDRGQPPLFARTRLCRCLRIMEPAYQRSRGAAMVAAISNLRRGHDWPSIRDV